MPPSLSRFLAEHPQVRRAGEDLLILMDARRILEARLPATGMQPAVCEYLELTGRAIMRDAGLPEEFVQECISRMPPREP